MDPAALPYSTARWLGFLGAFLAIGAVVFRVAVIRAWHRAHPGDAPVTAVLVAKAARLGLLGGMLLVVAAALRLWCQFQTLLDPGEPISRDLVQAILMETPWGHGWIAQLGAGVVTLGGFLTAMVSPAAGWVFAGIGTTLVAATAPLTGHAISGAAGSAGQVLDALHLLGGGAWLGTLTVVLAAGVAPLTRLDDEQRGPLTARLVRAFSPVALMGAGLAVLAGSLMSWRYLGASFGERASALLGTPWGQVLLGKLGTLILVALFGAWNWRVLLPRLGSAVAARRLHRSARVEIALGLVLLAVTAVLVALPMPAEGAGGMP